MPDASAVGSQMNERLQSASTGRGPGEGPAIARRPSGAIVPVTAAQEMFLVSHRWGAASAVDHVPIVMRRAGPLDAPALARALAQLAARHEILRARIDVEPDPPRLVIDETAVIGLDQQ